MSIESAQQFILRMKEDQTFRETILSSKSQAAAEQLVLAQGYNFTLDEVKSYIKPCETELTEEQLDAVTGGWTLTLYCTGGGYDWVRSW